MSNLQEVPTDDLLSFQDSFVEYPAVPVHQKGTNSSSGSTVSIPAAQIDISGNLIGQSGAGGVNLEGRMGSTGVPMGPADLGGRGTESEGADPQQPAKSFWTIDYYQKFFDVDTQDVLDRILASVTPKWDNTLKHHLRSKPDLYGPFWICVTLVFTIAISGNVANYLQHQSTKYHWKYDFHLVSYAATAICLYVLLLPSVLWAFLRYTSAISGDDVEELGMRDDVSTPGVLELICIYGYSLFVYIPAAILWSIQINLLQWLLVLVAAFVSGSVLLLTLMPALRLSKRKWCSVVGIVSCHLLLAAGFMLFFFHVPNTLPHAEDAPALTPVKAANLTGSRA